LRRSLLCVFLLLVWILSASILQEVASVSATTGPTATLKPAKYRVGPKIAALYPGQYVLQPIARGARLQRGQMAIVINLLGYLQGLVQFTGYDAQGSKSTWVATLYNFHLTTRDGMVIELFSPLQTQFYGYMYVRRTKQGDLVGQIALPKTRYAIQWHRTSSP
jgi:hypothetical protein